MTDVTRFSWKFYDCWFDRNRQEEERKKLTAEMTLELGLRPCEAMWLKVLDVSFKDLTSKDPQTKQDAIDFFESDRAAAIIETALPDFEDTPELNSAKFWRDLARAKVAE